MKKRLLTHEEFNALKLGQVADEVWESLALRRSPALEAMRQKEVIDSMAARLAEVQEHLLLHADEPQVKCAYCRAVTIWPFRGQGNEATE